MVVAIAIACEYVLNHELDDNIILYFNSRIFIQMHQHFPLYRHSDSNCTGADSAPEDEKFVRMRSKWDCLDKDISKEVLVIQLISLYFKIVFK